MNEDHQSHPFLSPNSQAYSSSSLSYNVFFGSATQDQSGFYHRETRPQHQQEADNFGAHSYDQIENENNGLKFSIWKKEVITNDQNQGESTNHQVKWMSSKMRVMLKMKKPDPTLDINVSNNSATVKVEDDQKLPLSPVETDNYSSNSSSSNNPIRVCSDCNTTKTPLWRSGPRGPKSLCNACGIRQRKARRAMAAAAAAESGTIIPAQASPFKAKLQPKDKKSPTSGHITKYKKRCKPAPPPSSPGRKNCFEDFLISLSKNLTFHRVFPQDEKEAAILLMALSCGYVHG